MVQTTKSMHAVAVPARLTLAFDFVTRRDQVQSKRSTAVGKFCTNSTNPRNRLMGWPAPTSYQGLKSDPNLPCVGTTNGMIDCNKVYNKETQIKKKLKTGWRAERTKAAALLQTCPSTIARYILKRDEHCSCFELTSLLFVC